jgi:hypothetical protein
MTFRSGGNASRGWVAECKLILGMRGQEDAVQACARFDSARQIDKGEPNPKSFLTRIARSRVNGSRGGSVSASKLLFGA